MGRQDYETETLVAQGAAHRENSGSGLDGVGVRTDGLAFTLEARSEVQAVAFSAKDCGADAGDTAPTLRAGGFDKSHANSGNWPAVAFGLDSQLNGEEEVIGPLNIGSASGSGQPARISRGMAVRRLTPRECERLQGFPDDYTLIPYRGRLAADGPRYKALGNSMAVPVMRWIGERIAAAESLA